MNILLVLAISYSLMIAFLMNGHDAVQAHRQQKHYAAVMHVIASVALMYAMIEFFHFVMNGGF